MKQLGVAWLLGLVVWMLVAVKGQPVVAAPVSQPMYSPTEQALRLYGTLTHKTVLRPGTLPQLADSVPGEMAADTNGAAALLERAFRQRHIEVVPDGDLFVRLLPEGWQESALVAQLLRVPAPPKRAPVPKEGAAAAMSVPGGSIDFVNAEISQVLEIYANFRNRTVLRPRRLSGYGFKLRTEAPLSREEAVYALNVALVLNGFAVVDDGLDFVQVVPIQEQALVQAQAPQPKVTAPLITPEEVPVFGSGALPYPLRLPTRNGQVKDPLAPPAKAATPPGVDDLVAYYAKLSGQKASASEFRHQSVRFKLQSPVTKAELLYAIETTLALDGLKIERQDDGTLQAVAK